MYGAAADERVYCPDCHRPTEVVLDHTTGNTICTEGALVLEAHYIDEGSKWRTFAVGGEDRDPSRVGGAGDPFLDAQLSTVITYSKTLAKADGEVAALPRMLDAGPAPEKALVDEFHAIAHMADRLGLVATIRDRVKEVFKKLDEAKGLPRGRNRGTVYAACLYIACRDLGMPRTYKELASVMAGGAATRKDRGGVEAGVQPRRAPQPRVHRRLYHLHGRAARQRQEVRQGRVHGHRHRSRHHQGGAQGPHPARRAALWLSPRK